jgi:predicted metal-binding membrane protein
MGMRDDMGPDLTMGGSWPLFLTMWVAMMVAMMFPAAAPMVLMYGRMRRNDPTSVSLFTGAYIALWIVFGVAAYLVSAAVESGAERSEWVASNWGRAGGVLILLAGVYQLSPLKEICVRQCRTPLSFVMTRWRDGRGGALRMGLTHGLYCMGCCWMLFVILIPLGVMNVAAMIAVAALVFAEKVLPRGRVFSVVAAVALIVVGLAVVGRPSLLPTVA